MVLLFSVTAVWAAEKQEKHPEQQPATNAPPEIGMLVFQGQELFEVISLVDVSIEQTLGMMERRLQRRAESPLFRTSDLRVKDNEAMQVALILAAADYIFATWEVSRPNISENPGCSWPRTARSPLQRPSMNITVPMILALSLKAGFRLSIKYGDRWGY